MVEPGSQNVRNPQGWFGQGAFRYKFDERFRGRRAYAVDPAVSDWKIFQMKTPLGHIGCVPFAEVVNLLGLPCLFLQAPSSLRDSLDTVFYLLNSLS